jgi:hypothetical protein
MLDPNECTICKRTLHDRHEHYIQRANSLRGLEEGEPLAFCISFQEIYDRTDSKAVLLALARKELKHYYPDKQFEIQPSRLMLTGYGQNSALLGEAHVVSYVVFEV